jgi:archaellum component FlaC
MLHVGKLIAVGVLAPALLIGCNRNEPRETTAQEPAASADAAANTQRERNDEIARLDQRVADIEREYNEASQEAAREKKTPTPELREELKEDVTNVKRAVSDLRTTTPDNWWTRHEQAIRQTADDIEADVSRLAGKVNAPPRTTTIEADGERVSTEPFTSRRDAFVSSMRSRVESMDQTLDKTDASGARKTEVEDVRARVKKLGDDLDRLRSASADEWWDVTRTRVSEYVDRIEGTIKRLDDVG